VREEIEHVRRGKHGARSTKQAIAIGLSKARRSGRAAAAAAVRTHERTDPAIGRARLRDRPGSAAAARAVGAPRARQRAHPRARRPAGRIARRPVAAREAGEPVAI
jgi:hypothetical protein